MKNSIAQFSHLHGNQPIPAESISQLTGKDSLSVRHDLCQQKSAPQPKYNDIAVQDWTISRQPDGKLFCMENGQTIPSTKRGEPDLDLIADGILNKTLFQA